MKILIADYEELLMPTHDLETQVLKDGLGADCEVEVYRYTDENGMTFMKGFQGRMPCSPVLLRWMQKPWTMLHT